MRRSRKALHKANPKKRQDIDMLDLRRRLEAAKKGKRPLYKRLESMLGTKRARELFESDLPVGDIERIEKLYKGNAEVLDHLMGIKGPKAPLKLYEVLGPERFKEVVLYLEDILPNHFDFLLVDATGGRSAKRLVEEIRAGFTNRTR